MTAISQTCNGKFNGDNLDLHIRTNDIRLQNRDQDYHIFASDWTCFRLLELDFTENAFLHERISREHLIPSDLEFLLPSSEELKLFRNSLCVLIGREFPTKLFKWMEDVVPSHIQHDLSDIMCQKTESFLLPILLKNEAEYEDCIDIMDS